MSCMVLICVCFLMPATFLFVRGNLSNGVRRSSSYKDAVVSFVPHFMQKYCSSDARGVPHELHLGRSNVHFASKLVPSSVVPFVRANACASLCVRASITAFTG